jgi:hypothetical protein
MSMQPENDDASQGRAGAMAALKEVATDPEMVREFGITAEAFSDEDYNDLITLAWRHQFDDDRSRFKRELRELQVHVTKNILDRMELSE